MTCPQPSCDGQMRIIDSRDMDDYRWRRRECPECQHRATTYERVAGSLAGAIKAGVSR